ncbi:MAG: hypothetical protein ACJA1Y_000701, partial [Burkholderiaceae bacterium]
KQCRQQERKQYDGSHDAGDKHRVLDGQSNHCV